MDISQSLSLDSSSMVKDNSPFNRFIQSVYLRLKVDDAKKKYNNKDALDTILKEGYERGLIDNAMIKNKLKEYIKDNRDKIWPL